MVNRLKLTSTHNKEERQMKKYIQIEMQILTFGSQDVIRTSGFLGGEEDGDGFGNPNGDTDPANFGA